MEWAKALAGAAGGLAHLGAAWHGQQCTCNIDLGEGFAVDKELIRLLEAQLQRCGPANLTVPAPCPVPECAGHPGSVVFLAALLAFILGILATSGVFWAWTLSQDRPGAEEQRTREPLPAQFDGRAVASSGTAGPRLLRPGPNRALMA